MPNNCKDLFQSPHKDYHNHVLAQLTLSSVLMSCFSSFILLFSLLFVLDSLAHFSLRSQFRDCKQDPLSDRGGGVNNDDNGVSVVTGVATVLGVLGVDIIGWSVSVELVTNGTSWARSLSRLSCVAITFVATVTTATVVAAGVVTATVAVDVVSVWHVFFFFPAPCSISDKTSRLSYKEKYIINWSK